MSTSCVIRIADRANPGDSTAMRTGQHLTNWEFTLLRNRGCGALTWSAQTSEANWASWYESYCAIDNLVTAYLDINDAGGAQRTWSGTLEDLPDPQATPPARTHRRFRARPTWAQLERPGAQALAVYTGMSINTVIDMLLMFFGEPQATLSSSTSEIIAGTTYNIVQAILEDAPLGPTIKKLAEINQATIYGVDAWNRIYFKDETPASTAPAHTFRMGTHTDGVVKFTRKQRQGKRANAFIVEGRDARSGNPMIVVAYDPALDTHPDPIWRWKRLRAPELVNGPDLRQWVQWLVAKEKDPLMEGTLAIAGIDTYLTAGAIRDLNCNVQVQDEDGVPLEYLSGYEQWPLQSITYRMTNTGSYDATLKMGNALPIDAMNELGVRELLQELAVFGAKEFSNQIEVQADDDPWPIVTYITFLSVNGMRNNIRIRLDNRIKSIDLEATDPGNGKLYSYNLKTNYDGGLTSDGGGDVVGQFVTTAIGVGDAYDTWALLRRIEYPVLIEGQIGAGRDDYFFEPDIDSDIARPVWSVYAPETSDGLNALSQEFIYPFRHLEAQEGGGPHNGFLLHSMPITFQTDIIFEFWWGIPAETTTTARYLIFNFKDQENYHFVLMQRGSSSTKLQWLVGKVIDGAGSVSPLGAEITNVGTSSGYGGQLVRVTLAPNVPLETYTVTVANIHAGNENSSQQTQQLHWWQPAAEMVYAGFRWTCPATSPPYDSEGDMWCIKKMTFDNATLSSTANWYISRDDKATWEGPFDTILGTSVDLGAYPGDASDDMYIKGFVTYPQILTGIAAGWK